MPMNKLHCDCNFPADVTRYVSGEYKDENDGPCMIRWKSGKKVDPRLMTVLESFREIYVKNREFFEKIFPGNYEEFIDVFKKMGAMLTRNKRVKAQTIQRSLSLGSPRLLKPERFKVRTPPVIVTGTDGDGGQSDQDSK